MRLSELLAEAKTYGKKYTETEMMSLEKPNHKNVNSAFRVGSVIFDNESGLGSTPNNSEIIHLGFAIELDPIDFLRIVSPGDREDDADKITSLMKEGIPFGSPFIGVFVNLEDWRDGSELVVKVMNHEGRARALAFSRLNPGKKIPVHVIPYGGWRSKDFNQKFFDDLRKTGIIHEDKSSKSKPIKLDIGRIFWNYTTL